MTELQSIVATWHRRYRSRRKLARLSDRQMHDAGIDRFRAEREIQKPFWRA